MICEEYLLRFQKLLVEVTGIAVPAEELCNLSSLLEQLAGEQTKGDVDAYLLLLASRLASHTDWERIALEVTVGESYFLRDRGQIELLESAILPRLIESNQDSRSLRIVSAGCSSGEEPYSVAMLLHKLLPDWSAWDLDIVGLDINPEAIRKAKTGIYRQWSFRGQGKTLQPEYFSKDGDCWRLNNSIQRVVRFYQHNLTQDALPDSSKHLCDVDLIICRNVFIYFSHEAIGTVLKKFIHTLRTDGYLLTGHVELTGQDLSAFDTVQMPESLVYRKRATPMQPSPSSTLGIPLTTPQLQLKELKKRNEQHSPARPATPKQPAEDTPVSRETPSEQSAENLFQFGEYDQVITLLGFGDTQLTEDNMKLLIEACVNSGKIEEACKQCTRFIERDDLNPFPYYLLAHLAQEKGDVSEAKKLLRKVIYLDPQAIGAYLSLGNLYAAEGNHERAERERRAALKELQKFDVADPVPYLDEMRVAQVIDQIEGLVKEGV